jgi:mRNA interferase YafQ
MKAFRPRKTFERDLAKFAKIDHAIVAEVMEAIEILLEFGELPAEYNDHKLERNLAAYNEFHLRDTMRGQQPNEVNDVIVQYRWDDDYTKLILIATRIGSHQQLFGSATTSKK